MSVPANDVAGFRFWLRCGTTAQWLDADPVLGPGEPGVDLDLMTVRFGDGVRRYSQLPELGSAELAALVAQVNALDALVADNADALAAETVQRIAGDAASAAGIAALGDELDTEVAARVAAVNAEAATRAAADDVLAEQIADAATTADLSAEASARDAAISAAVAVEAANRAEAVSAVAATRDLRPGAGGSFVWPGGAATSQTSQSASQYFWPFPSSRPFSFTSVSFSLSGAMLAGNTAGIAFYRQDAAGAFTLVADCGNVSGASTGVKTLTGGPWTLSPGNLWVSFIASASFGAHTVAQPAPFTWLDGAAALLTSEPAYGLSIPGVPVAGAAAPSAPTPTHGSGGSRNPSPLRLQFAGVVLL